MRTPIQDDSCGCRQLASVMAALRAPGGCPWDREQTHESLVPYLIEETYEAVDAIADGAPGLLKEELGDVALQIAFHAQLAAEVGRFTLDDVLRACTAKLIRRHPHVFEPATSTATTSDQVVRQWDQIKQQEGKPPRHGSLLADLPSGLPGLPQAQQVQTRAARVGFDWEKAEDVFSKLAEEIAELHEAISDRDQRRIADELGDVMFTVVNLARRLNLDAESALRGSTRRFAARFEAMERAANRPLADYSLSELNQLWETAKERPLERSDGDVSQAARKNVPP